MPALGLKNLEYRAELALPYTRWDLLQKQLPSNRVSLVPALAPLYTGLNFLTSAVSSTPSAIWP